jgi:acetoin utilization deacetylase AcuC-like enzyme
MEITTIQLSKETKDKLSSFGLKGESYDKIIQRIYSLALKEQIREILMSSEGFISIEDAIKEANEKWPK